MPGAPGIAPTMPPSSASPLPGEVQRPSAGTSSGQGATSGFSPTKKEDSESDEYLEIATLYAQKGKYQKAEELFQKVAKENPSSAKAHNNLGVVRLKQEKYDMAEREFKEAMRLEPAFVLPYYNLACLYSKKGVSVEALIYLKKALKRDERVKQWVKTDKDFDRLRSSRSW
jgi:tetratricopeptide (TPR) repeat protein